MTNFKKSYTSILVQNFKSEAQEFRRFMRFAQNDDQTRSLFHNFSMIETEMLQALQGSPVRFWGDHSLRKEEFEYAERIIQAFQGLNEALKNPATDADAIKSAIAALIEKATNKDQTKQPVEALSWGYLFLGTVLGALAGAVIAMLIVFSVPYLTPLWGFVLLFPVLGFFYEPLRDFIATLVATLPVASILSYFDPLHLYAPGEAIFPSAHTFFLSGLIGAGIGAVAGFAAAYYYSSSAYQNYSFFKLKDVGENIKSFSTKLNKLGDDAINQAVGTYRQSLAPAQSPAQ